MKDRNPFHIGSPFQLDFKPGDPADMPAPMAALREHVPTCWDPILKCSCGDCPDAPACSSHDAAVPPASHGCVVGFVAGVTVYCSNLVVLAVAFVALSTLCWAYASGKLGSESELTGITAYCLSILYDFLA